ncbi:MAG: phosphatidate cytidylyltransferase, partial [Clostridia bacterium]|nr:phosphatidate cytidylyltransferase [Clostridia bacterium]
MLRTKIKTVAVLNVIVIPLVIFADRVPYLMNAAVSFLAVYGLIELYRACGMLRKRFIPAFALNAAANLALCFAPIPWLSRFVAGFYAAAVLFFALLMTRVGSFRFDRVWKVFPVGAMLGLFYRCIVEVRASRMGMYLTFLMIIVSIVNEMGGYFIGRRFGKKKLAPAVSPNKTIEGSLGGAASAILIALSVSEAAGAIAGFDINGGRLFVYTLLSSAAVQFGDLCMSAVKRTCGIKDFGRLMPGHGGVLDRFDGQLFS